MKTFIRYIIACQIEIHWWFIMRYKKGGKRMIEKKESYKGVCPST